MGNRYEFIRTMVIIFNLLYLVDFFHTLPILKITTNILLVLIFSCSIFWLPKINRNVCLSFFVIGLGIFAVNHPSLENFVRAFDRNGGLVTLFTSVPMMSMPFFYDDYQSEIANISKRYMKSLLPFLFFILFCSYSLSSLTSMSCLILMYELFNRQASDYNCRRLFRSALLQGYAASGFWGPAWNSLILLTARVNISWLQMLIPGLFVSVISLIVSAGLLWLSVIRDPGSYPPLSPDKNISVDWQKIRNITILAVGLVLLLIFLNYHTGWSMFIIIPLVSFPFALLTAFVQGKFARFAQGMKNYYRERLCKGQAELCLFISAGFLGTELEKSGIVSFFLAQLPSEIFEYKFIFIVLVIFLILLMAAIGIHPVVLVPVIAASITPLSIGFDKLTFAMLLLSGWILGVTFSPFSTSNMIVSGLENISAWQVGPYTNWRYTGIMFVILSLIVWFFYLMI